MSNSDSPKRRRPRRDGWTPERQLLFLQMLAKTRKVSKAAAHVRLSRDSAYRLRSRLKGELFALAWDSLYAPRFAPSGSEMDKHHIAALRLGLRPERIRRWPDSATMSKP
jgi:hypothetical protein